MNIIIRKFEIVSLLEEMGEKIPFTCDQLNSVWNFGIHTISMRLNDHEIGDLRIINGVADLNVNLVAFAKATKIVNKKEKSELVVITTGDYSLNPIAVARMAKWVRDYEVQLAKDNCTLILNPVYV